MIGREEGPERAKLDAAAAAWVVRLSGDEVDEADWIAFLGWLDDASSPGPDLRRAAFDRAQALWLDLDALRESPRAPARRRRPPRSTSRRRSNVVGLACAAVAAAAFIAAFGLWMGSNHTPGDRGPPSAFFDDSTPPGRERAIRLADGSRIDMDGATALTVDLRNPVRRVNLLHGEARFDVAHDPARPFQVDLGRAQVSVLGTAFDVIREDDSTQVGVARGAVRFRAGAQSVTLPAGRSARLGARGVIELARVSPADVGAWRAGRRVYWDRPVQEVVADMNRRYPQPIRLEGREAERMRFTGVLMLGTRDQMVGRLTTLLRLDAKAGQGGEIVLSARRP